MSIVASLSDHALQTAVCEVAGNSSGFRKVTTRREAIEVVGKVIALFPVAAAALCGSFARGEQTGSSDIDVLAAFEPGARLGDVEAAREALEYATGRSVDLITTLEGQTESFRASVIRDGVRVYG